MGKKKNKNKISGAEKTAAKTEKKLLNRMKKELMESGEDEISLIVAEIEKQEAKLTAVVEKILDSPPSPRAYATLTPHPITNELIMFGGEFHNGSKTEVYNDLLIYNPVNNRWKQIKAPGAPAPRSAHQAVASAANKGELWVFGGEFTSPKETQFHHYKDLWNFSFAEKKWTKVSARHGPCARSGHRMVMSGRTLYVFGGYSDAAAHAQPVYHDDLHAFCTERREWARVRPRGAGPGPRSACVMLPAGPDALMVYGGVCRTRSGRTEQLQRLNDGYRLVRRGGGDGGDGGGGGGDGGDGGGAWEWRSLPAPAQPPRCSLAAAANTLTNRGYVFGGTHDLEETEDDIVGEMSDELQMIDLNTYRWHDVAMRGPRVGAAPGAGTGAADGAEEDDDIDEVAEGVSSLCAGGGGGGPGGRMSAMLAVQRSKLYLYGGVVEKDHRQFYLSDMYCLDLRKLNGWKTIIEQPPLPAWLDSDSDTETASDDDSEDTSDSDN